jgi:hypothetical protein
LTLRAAFRLAYRRTKALIGSIISLLVLQLRVLDRTTRMWTRREWQALFALQSATVERQ